jgi:voltage-gated potassium channel
MGSHAPRPAELTVRELVEFYLLDHETRLGKAIDVALLVLNVVFVSLFVLETYDFAERIRPQLWQLEVFIGLIFLVEYLLRIYGAPSRLAEALNPYTIVDFVTIVPTISVLVLPGITFTALEIGFLRALRIVRFLRFYRFTQDQEFFFGTVSVQQLRVMKLLLTVFTIFFVSAGLFYSFENTVNPGVNNFGDAFYYVVVTITTVGFGDITPMTTGGRWVTVSAILAGIILVPWQISKIVKEWTTREMVNVTCPDCGLEYHDPDASHCKACGHVIYQEFDSRQ